MPFSALFIDMDGVLLDTERLALRCWQQAANEFGFELSEHLFAQVIGRTLHDTRQIFCANLGASFDFDQVRARRRALGATQIHQEGMPVKQGAEALLCFARDNGIACAIVTSTESEEAHERLQSAQLPYQHCLLVGGEVTPRGKPAPDLYLAASTQLGQNPKHCVVVEDSIPGIHAASAAGMLPILVPDIVTPDQHTLSLAFKVCPTLDEVLAVLKQL